MPLFKKPKAPNKMKILEEEEKSHPRFLGNLGRDEILQSNGVKPPKTKQRQFVFVNVFQNNVHLLPKTYKISLLCTHLPPYI